MLGDYISDNHLGTLVVTSLASLSMIIIPNDIDLHARLELT